MGPLNILLAEDNADDSFFLQRALEKANLKSRLLVTCDGIETVKYLKAEEPYADRATCPFPDLLLLDLNMPRMNGFEVLQWVRREALLSHLVVHVFSASIRECDVRRAYELGANSYVEKPRSLSELAAFVTVLHQWHRFAILPSCMDQAHRVGYA